MKKFIKNAALLLLTGGLFLGTVNLGACSKVPDEPIDDDQKHEQVLPEDKDKDDKKPPVVPDDGKDDGNDDGKVDDKKALFEAAGRVSALVEEAENTLNFLYVEGEKSFYAQNLDDGFRLKVSTGNVDTYYVGTKTEPNAEAYNVMKVYKNAEGSWVGEAATDEIITESPFILYGAEWTKFENGKLLGTVDNKSVSASVDEGLTTVTWAINNVEYSLSQIGEVSLQIPEYEDLTKPAGEYVYETVNGQREYNIPVLAKALEETLKADSTILTKASSGIKTELIKITHIKNNEDGIGFGAYCSSENNSRPYKYFVLNEKLMTGDRATEKEFANMLKQSSSIKRIRNLGCETSTVEDEELKIMADNILVKLAQDGCQETSIKNKVEGVTEFANAKALFGCKTKNSGITAGGDMGNQTSSEYMLIVKKANGEMKELNLKISVAYSQYGQNFNLLNLNTEKVIIINYNAETIEKENAKLYENSSNIKLNTAVTPYIETKRN